jgi:hypothetical protein
MTPTRSLTLAALLALLVASPVSAHTLQQAETAAWVGDGACAARFNAGGVMVGAPATGLTLLDDEQLDLTGPLVEWVGVSYRGPQGTVRAVAEGNASDWAGRPPVTTREFAHDQQALLSVARAGDLEIRTEVLHEPRGPWLSVTVRLKNKGREPLHDVRLTREWLDPDALVRLSEFAMLFGTISPARHGRVRAWEFGDLPPKGAASLSYRLAPAEDESGAMEATALDVPVNLWVGPSHPWGLPVGATNGISWGDFDADGWIDIFAAESGNLWRNLGGTDWELAADLDDLMPPATIRYGASFGDYDNDGLPDLAIEPRKVLTGDTCFHLLHNEGGGLFTNVTINSVLDGQPCLVDGETVGWADVDGDGLLDLFLPAYPAWVLEGTGNFFFHNLGPGVPNGGYQFKERSALAGLDNPLPDSARPEGAQFVDVDGDGDVDLYSNGTLYSNRSKPGQPRFEALPEASSGIGLSTELDEGAMFFDYDMDGDDDLFIAYTSSDYGVRIWENLGDGSFFGAENSLIFGSFAGLGLGMSAEDWDNDGDIDFSTRHIFRKNLLIETGSPGFGLAFHPIPAVFTTSATPAWGDWDKDGDLDLALGNYLGNGSFWFNILYEPDTPLEERRHVRVRVLRDSESVPAGLETEYGAVVELFVEGDGLRRRKFVASGHGYLNQNEYTLTFALPEDPYPEDPTQDVRFDVVVTFAGSTGNAVRRVDRFVNPVLGGVDLAALADRELVVYRSGRVRRDGLLFEPDPLCAIDLVSSSGGLATPDPDSPLPPVLPAPTVDRYVGIDFSTNGAQSELQVREIILDGQLDLAQDCGGVPTNIVLWDVTNPGAPQIAPDGRLAATTSPRNDRSSIPVDLRLQPDRRYRLVAAVTDLRLTPVQDTDPTHGLLVRGGLSFRSPQPCQGSKVVQAMPEPGEVPMSLRYGPIVSTAWMDLGGSLAGATGTPRLSGSGLLVPEGTIEVSLNNAARNAAAWAVLGGSVVDQPFKGGVMVPDPLIGVGGLVTDGAGQLLIAATLPPGPIGPIVLQFWIQDAGGPQGWAASNGVMATPTEPQTVDEPPGR